MPQPPKADSRWFAACTFAMAAAVTPAFAAHSPAAPIPAVAAAPSATAGLSAVTLSRLQRYCQSSWRNAGIHPQEWTDCNQQAIAELLQRVSQTQITAALHDADTPERRELNRTIWRIVQRWRRRPRSTELLADQAAAVNSTASDHAAAQWREVEAARRHVTDRQWQILSLCREGWSIREIAAELDLSAARVSDEKYKAVRKLRSVLA